ncbi:MAG: serine/threonine protein kinase [Muribaculaceae bacterium]|nr:serine/threonine protein kinase [Muribaculaceae bacterium]
MELYLGEYNNLRSLGEGSFADVYLVRHHTLGYIRALKVSKDNIMDESDRKWQKFLKECRLLLRVGNGGHPNIIKIYQPRLVNNKAVVEMDYVEGDSLQSYIEQCQFLPFKEVWKFIKDIIGAMAYCHVDVYRYLMNPKEDGLSLNPFDGRKYDMSKEKEDELIEKYGVCHNDLHAKNIMRRNLDGSYILLDFGLAIQNRQAVNSSNMDKGAIEYSAPEKFDHLEPTIRSDVYSLGILLYKVLTGVVPFPLNGTTERSKSDVWKAKRENPMPSIFTLRRQAFEKVHPYSDYTRDYPEAFDNIISKCLAVRPEDRYKNAKELLYALEDAYSTFDELSRLDNDNVRLSDQLSLAYSRIEEIESSVIQSKKQLDEKDKIIEDAAEEIRIQQEACSNASRKAGEWKRKAIIFPLMASVVFGTIAIFAGYKSHGVNPHVGLSRSTADSMVMDEDNNTIVERIVIDTVMMHDTVYFAVPETITGTPIEYRISPEVQQELMRLRARNRELQEQVQRAKNAAQ